MPSMGQNKGTLTLTERFAHDEALWKHCKKIYKQKKQTTKKRTPKEEIDEMQTLRSIFSPTIYMIDIC